ncbi:MAG: ATP-binding protein [bacterium]|nr:ATP-binding protein [bacterium]
MNTYIPRSIEADVRASAQKMPIIVMTGPRQSGKTTLAKRIFPEYMYANLEFPDVRLFAEQDPRGFLTQSKTMIIDEIQRLPDLFSYIQGFVDEDPSQKYILTGSNNFALMHTISQSLAGRAALFTILPFSIEELRRVALLSSDLPTAMFQGWYPRVIAEQNNPREWYQGYIQTYLERDVRDTSAIHMMELFYVFLRVLANRTGSLLNYAEIGKEVGVSSNTIRGWLSILQASYIVYTLPPYHTNTKKRLVKSSKVYFYDVGLLCSLLGIIEKGDVLQHPNAGALFENFVISEYMKEQALYGRMHTLMFYRDHAGVEVDLVREEGASLALFEIKLHKTFSSDFLRGMKLLQHDITTASSLSVVYGGEVSQKLSEGTLVAWKDIA